MRNPMLWESHYKFSKISPDVTNGYIQRLLKIGDPFLFLRNYFRWELVFYTHKFLKSVIFVNFSFIVANTGLRNKAIIQWLCLLRILYRCNISERIQIFLFPLVNPSAELRPLARRCAILYLFLQLS
jgi:hypothetical protein